MLLNGWNEIAKYLNASVRGVQRWQRAGLPVIRPGGTRGSIIAYSEQIDVWLRKTRPVEPSLDLKRAVDKSLRQARQLSEQLRAGWLQMEAHMTSLKREVVALRAAVARMKQPTNFYVHADCDWYGHSGFKKTLITPKRLQ